MFSTLVTGSGAVLAMVMFVLTTFIAAPLTDLRTELTKRRRKFAIKRHKLRGKTTNIGTLHIQFYARAHHIDIFFFKA